MTTMAKEDRLEEFNAFVEMQWAAEILEDFGRILDDYDPDMLENLSEGPADRTRAVLFFLLYCLRFFAARDYLDWNRGLEMAQKSYEAHGI